jgi:hypothetical protein
MLARADAHDVVGDGGRASEPSDGTDELKWGWVRRVGYVEARPVLAGWSADGHEMDLARSVSRLARSQDTVLVDTPPLLDSADALEIARVSDAVLVVLRHRKTTELEGAEALHVLARHGARVLGLVINASPASRK